MSVAVAARLLGVSRTTVESWRQAGVLASAAGKRQRHEVTIDSLVGSGRTVSSVTTCGGRPKTLPTTQMASLPRHCASSAPESSAKSMCRRTKTSTGRSVNSMIRHQGSQADGRDRTDAAGPPADRRLARQGEGVLHRGCAGNTPARMRGRRRPAGGRTAFGHLPAGPLRRVASPHHLRGTGPMRLLLVAEHTRSANPYQLLYAALGIDEPDQPRTKPPCCDSGEQPPVAPDLVARFERGLQDLDHGLRSPANTRRRQSASVTKPVTTPPADDGQSVTHPDTHIVPSCGNPTQPDAVRQIRHAW